MTTHRLLNGWAARHGHLAVLGAIALAGAVGCKNDKVDTGIVGECDAPQRLASGEGYRFAVGGTLHGTAIAAKSFNTQGNAVLELLSAGKAAVKVADAAVPEAIQVAAPAGETGTHRAMILEGGTSEGTGTLTVVDMVAGEKVALPNGNGVPSNGFWFGAHSGQILFVGSYNTAGRRGALYWSEGTSAQRLEGAEGVPAESVLFTLDRETAVVGIGVSTETANFGVGRLAVVKMGSGTVRVLGENVKVLGRAGQRWIRNFSLSDDGKVTFANTAGEVLVASLADGPASVVAEEGHSPGLSADGAYVAWYRGNEIWARSLAGSAEARRVTTIPNTGASTNGPPPTPVFLSGNQRVLFLGSWSWFVEGAIGHAYIAPVAGGTASEVGRNVAWNTITFLPNGSIAAVAEKENPAAKAPDYSRPGKLRLGSPELAFTTLATDVYDFAAVVGEGLDASAELVYLSLQGTSPPVGEVFSVRVSDESPHARSVGTVGKAGSLVQQGSKYAIVLDQESQRLDGTHLVGTVYTGVVGESLRATSYNKAIRVGFTPNRRVIAVIGAGGNAGVVTMPECR